MTKISFGIVILALAVAEVTCWTIGLPEARKFLFEKNDRLVKERYEEEKYKSEKEKQIYFSNRESSNSKHHEDPHTHRRHHDHASYAKEYGYQSYMEKKVRDIVQDGSEYLEGLRRSIQRYSDFLENCTRADRKNRYRFNNTTYKETTFNATAYNATLFESTTPWLPQSELPTYNGTLNVTERCRRATRASERVRRLAELATKATKELQDIAYTRRYMKDDPKELSKAENELILKLAWFLDRLAYYTGYSPRPRPAAPQDYKWSTSPPPPPPSVGMMNASAPVMRVMMNCLKMKSAIPATVRCAYPVEMPDAVVFILNNSNPVPPMPAASNLNERVLVNDQELLVATDDRPPYAKYSRELTAVRNVINPAKTPTSFRTKRSVEDPAITFMKYFVKHKIFESDNPTDTKYAKDVFREFEVNNHLRQKRKVKLPEDPYQDLSKYVKNKKGVHLVPDAEQARKLRDAIFKITNTKPSSPKEHTRKMTKLNLSVNKKDRYKRSYTFEENLSKPREPDDLFKDLSYYVKNKEGTNLNSDVIQAGQVRGGLAQIFLNPNIEIVRRYGSNFNPLIPDPLLFAALRGGADN